MGSCGVRISADEVLSCDASMCSDRELSSPEEIDCLTISRRVLALLCRYDCWVRRRSSIEANFSSSTSKEIMSFRRFLGLSTTYCSASLSEALWCVSTGSGSLLALRLRTGVRSGTSLAAGCAALEPLRLWPVPRVFGTFFCFGDYEMT